MVIRVLPTEEYHRLAGIEEGFVPDPEASKVVVAEQDGEIIGRWMLVGMPHLEGCWVAPKARNRWVAYRMEQKLCTLAKDLGLNELLAFTTNDQHTKYMERLGWEKMNLTVLRKHLEDK